MSAVGGARLGEPGTQVQLEGGAPVLPKDLSAKSWIVADAESGDVLAAHNPHWRLPPASTLKMLLADTLLPKFPAQEKHKVAASDLAGMGEGSSLVGIKENETYSVHDLWLGVFLRSGNDAVHVLSAMNGGVAQTVKDMQAHADELQADDTTVVSPDGYDEPRQVSSAYDLTLFARSGLQKKDFRTYCSTVRAEFPGETKKTKDGTKRGSFEIQNTNRLLTGDYGLAPYKGIAGVKNGNTTNAGATFTGVAERDNRVLLVTVMNPDSGENLAVYKEAERLFDWGFDAAGKTAPIGTLVAPKSATTGGSQAGGRHGPAAGDSPSATASHSATAADGSSGMGIAFGVIGGVVLLLAAGIYAINRTWPLPGLRTASGPTPGAGKTPATGQTAATAAASETGETTAQADKKTAGAADAPARAGETADAPKAEEAPATEAPGKAAETTAAEGAAPVGPGPDAEGTAVKGPTADEEPLAGGPGTAKAPGAPEPETAERPKATAAPTAEGPAAAETGQTAAQSPATEAPAAATTDEADQSAEEAETEQSAKSAKSAEAGAGEAVEPSSAQEARASEDPTVAEEPSESDGNSTPKS